ncbi:DUF2617 family protein [Gordonia rhizosphera]|uniref:DUF2617 family protein n=1 Tax=Gordonia rhizosphera NBRC 16068 TaxID=1108045 RepID=K6VPZ6_9ACTN|nr:DUF2617 family protein [Gordonia rhizosphera]GAB88980.1 hypothetical protein GORHZ_046_01320 [Gordonia rhizosphera NBRC 16068]
MSASSTTSVHTSLDVPFADTSAQQLSFSLTADVREPLARCDHRFGPRTISLRLLGASHQVIVDDGHRRLCETVACLPDVGTPLPGTVADGVYAFSSRVDRCDLARLESVVAGLVRRTCDHRAAGLPALLGRFPGRPLAVTAVIASADDDTITWQTWHTYPQCGELVTTTGELRGTPAR